MKAGIAVSTSATDGGNVEISGQISFCGFLQTVSDGFDIQGD